MIDFLEGLFRFFLAIFLIIGSLLGIVMLAMMSGLFLLFTDNIHLFEKIIDFFRRFL